MCLAVNLGEWTTNMRLRECSGLDDVPKCLRDWRAEGWPIDVHRRDAMARLTSLAQGETHSNIEGIPPSMRMATLTRDDFRCQKCGFRSCELNNRGKMTRVDAHHIVHRKNSGPNTLENLVTLCNDCHAQTHGIES